MALIPQITSVSSKHGKTARATELAISKARVTRISTLISTLISTITPKTITKR
jgi:hypothetical protein